MVRMTRAERMQRAIDENKERIEKSAKAFGRYSREELLELAASSGVYVDKGYRKSWIAYDLAVRVVTGY